MSAKIKVSALETNLARWSWSGHFFSHSKNSKN